MSKIIHRVLFASGVILLGILVFLPLILSVDDYERFNQSSLAQFLDFIGGCTLLFYPYTIVRSLIDIISKRRKRWYLWIPFVVAVPVVGSYLYYEKYLLKPLRQSFTSDEQIPLTNSAYLTDAKTNWFRLVALLIDIVMFLVLTGFYTRLFGVKLSNGSVEVKGFEAMFLLLIYWLMFFPIFEFIFGGTLGKIIMGLRVKMQNESKLTIEAAFKRHLLDIIDFPLLLFMIPTTKKNNGPPRRLGDRWAKTIVVSRRK
jgi:uncharacterized RDD family membrane protein YckC